MITVNQTITFCIHILALSRDKHTDVEKADTPNVIIIVSNHNRFSVKPTRDSKYCLKNGDTNAIIDTNITTIIKQAANTQFCHMCFL